MQNPAHSVHSNYFREVEIGTSDLPAAFRRWALRSEVRSPKGYEFPATVRSLPGRK
jgi:hypothetical protein